MNNNNQNGKEVHKGQMPENIKREGKARPVNRRKKKITSGEKDTIPKEPKKISLNINKNTGNPSKSSNKGQVIKLGDKENRTHPVDTPPKEVRGSDSRPMYSSDKKNAFSTESAAYKETTDNNPIGRTDKEKLKLLTYAGTWLLIAAAILFIAWAVMFFYYKIGGNSHMLLALAVVCAIVSLVGRKK